MNNSVPSVNPTPNFGMAVDLKDKKFGRRILRNVTEIHYNYDSPIKSLMGAQIAFESNIHVSGFTMPVADLMEFETYCETEKQPEF